MSLRDQTAYLVHHSCETVVQRIVDELGLDAQLQLVDIPHGMTKDTGLSGDFSFPLKYNRTEVLLVSFWTLEETFLDDDIHLFLATRRGKLDDHGLVVFQEQRFVAFRMFFVAIIGDLYYRSVHTSHHSADGGTNSIDPLYYWGLGNVIFYVIDSIVI